MMLMPGMSPNVAAEHLRAFIERIENLLAEKRSLTDDIREVFAEAKGTGFDTKAMRAIITLRRLDPSHRHEIESIIDLYKSALGMP